MSGYSLEESNADRNVEIWKIKKLIKSLEAARGLALHLFISLSQLIISFFSIIAEMVRQ
jgi:hypothetical protein